MMLRQIYDYIHELILNPPLSPGGSGGGGVQALPSINDPHNNNISNNNNNDPLILRYLPLIILLTLFWPIFVTGITVSITASAWLFWLCIGATTGLIQLLYVLYSFFMITWDLAILVSLKTFSMLRRYLRRYYYKVVFATYKSMGIEPRRRRRGRNSGSGSNTNNNMGSGNEVKRRRKEWSQEVGRVTSYKEYEEIEIYEPIISSKSTSSSSSSSSSPNHASGKTVMTKKTTLSSSTGVRRRKPHLVRRSVSAGINSTSSSTDNNSDDLGLRRRKGGQNEQNEKEGGGRGGTGGEVVMIPLSPIRTIEESPTRSSSRRASTAGGESSPSSPMRKIHSCLDFKGQSTSKTARGVGGVEKPWIQRTYSSNSLPVTAEEEDSDDDDRTGCVTWQSVVQDDLGMEGSMLLTTLARLKEARVQASSYGGGSDDVTNNSEESNDVDDGDDDDMRILPNLSSLSNPWDEEEGEEKSKSFHITASFTKKRTKRRPWNEDNSSSLKTLLSGIVKRNHLSIENHLIQDAQSIAERGQHSLRKETRDAIDRYSEEVERCIDWIAHGPVYLGPSGSGGEDDEGDDHGGSERRGNTPKDVMEKQREELARRYTLVKRMKQNVGHTALMLSGGGAQTMYHLGSIKALIEAGIYEHIHVISGTSGGSISAAMCAIKTPAELLRDICVRTVASDYMLTGEQKKQNIRWFPKAFDMGAHFLKHGLVCDAAEFKRTCDFYYKDITFEEAYEMTKKHVCITVTASRASSGKGMQRLLLNHISTPNVTLASAVRASCALPGVFAPASLMIKDSRGKEVPFEVDGVEWIDGSVQADIPVKRISTLFNVSNYVVCQTNFHVAPFIHKSHHPSINSLYWKA